MAMEVLDNIVEVDRDLNLGEIFDEIRKYYNADILTPEEYQGSKYESLPAVELITNEGEAFYIVFNDSSVELDNKQSANSILNAPLLRRNGYLTLLNADLYTESFDIEVKTNFEGWEDLTY